MTAIDDSIIHNIRMREHKLLSELLPDLALKDRADKFVSSDETEINLSQGEKIQFTEGPLHRLKVSLMKKMMTNVAMFYLK